MNTNQRVSHQGAKAQRQTATGSRLAFRHVYFSALPGFLRRCVFASLREIRTLLSTAITTLLIALSSPCAFVLAQTTAIPNSTPTQIQPAVSRYLDQTTGLTADDAVTYALAHNGELDAARKEIEAARALVKQAGLRPNPMLEAGGTQMIIGADKSYMVSGALSLELGGRRAARIAVAEREVEVREHEVANRERLLAAEVRAKFGEALARALKVSFTDELVEANQQSFNLIAARVIEGATPPLEQNMALVELNRLRSMRETVESKVEVAMLELRNLLGMDPAEPLRLRGDYLNLLDQLPPVGEATERALRERPDLRMMRAGESLAAAQIEQARAEGRTDASLNAGYQRMETGFPLSGINDQGALSPIMKKMNLVTFGVTFSLAVRNKNQGSIEAAVALSEAAKKRREFAELTVRREVAASYALYERAARAEEIFRVGVRDPARANLDVVRQTYELGSKTLIDYIGEQRRFIELENDFIEAELALYLARVDIARVTYSPALMK
jgi:outer membrane protein, heavy metal efflux system